MEVYTANYYNWDNSKFFGVFSTFEKAIETLKEYYNKNKGMKCDYVVTKLIVDKGTNSTCETTLEDIELWGMNLKN